MTTYVLNRELNGIEISFTEKPATAILAALKNSGFHWHKTKKLWYAKQNAERLELAQKITNSEKVEAAETVAAPKKAAKNKYGVQVGDVFSCSWGYEQTNVNFFQVVELVGAQMVRIKEVFPEMIEDSPVSGMSSDRTYKITREPLPVNPRSVFIKDSERGDLKKIQPGYDKDEKKAALNCFIKIDTFAWAYKCNGATEKTYESWYY